MTEWIDGNQRFLVASLALLRLRLEGAPALDLDVADTRVTEARVVMTSPPAIEVLGDRFQLSGFERALLLLCAGVELDAGVAATCAKLQGDGRSPLPTFALALARLPGAHWSALGPEAALRRFALIELGVGPSLTRRSLAIAERVLHYLVGVDQPDVQLRGVLSRGELRGPVVPSHAGLADQIARAWRLQFAAHAGGVIALVGPSAAIRRDIAAAACQAAEVSFDIVSSAALTARADHDELLPLLARESVLRGSAVLVEIDEVDDNDPARMGAILRFLRTHPTPLVVGAPQRPRIPSLDVTTFEATRPTPDEQRSLWMELLRPLAPALGEDARAEIARLPDHFDLGSHEISAALMGALTSCSSPGELPGAIWDACRTATQNEFGPLAQRIEPTATWDDLILSPTCSAQLREIVAWCRNRTRLRDEWGFREGTRGRGVVALFAGPSGTGKTSAAEILANELKVDLCRVDLSQVVSKYIGETEKHLRQVFNAAERSGALLLFDEADALFSRRAEVRGSIDRYANLEVAYLLQRIEAFRGLVVLTTNLDHAIDPAFIRRFSFVLGFSWPRASERAAIWRRAFPSQTPLDGVNFDELAELSFSGAMIRNIARRAAHIAHVSASSVRTEHILEAARTECAMVTLRRHGTGTGPEGLFGGSLACT